MRASGSDYKLWFRPREWANDFPGHVFLARACEMLGQEMFAEGWKGISNGPARSSVLERIREDCAYGRLAAVALAYKGNLIKIPAERWYGTDCWEWFPTCTISNFATMRGIHPLAGVSEFPLFITFESLGMVLRGNNAPKGETAVPERPERDELDKLMHTVKRVWEEKGKTSEYRITREEFHKLARKRWPGVSTTESRLAFEDQRPFEWSKPGKFTREGVTLDDLSAVYGIPQSPA